MNGLACLLVVGGAVGEPCSGYLQVYARKYKMSDSDKCRSNSSEVPDSSVPGVDEYRATGQTEPNNLSLFLCIIERIENI